MIKHNIVFSFRLFKKNFSYSLINIVGLTLGMTVTVFVSLWVIEEIHFDRFHHNINEIYRVYEIHDYSSTDNRNVYFTPGLLAPLLREQFPVIKKAARFTPINKSVVISYKNEMFYNSNGYFGDQEALDIFTFNFIYGVASNTLNNPNSIILTKETSELIFGRQNPIGKSIIINAKSLYTVLGVVDKPKNTHLNFSFIIPYDGNREKFRYSCSWQDNNCYTYLQIDRSIQYNKVEKEIAKVASDNGQENTVIGLEPLSRSYLYNIWGTGAISNVRIFAAIAVLILFIASFNFINLTTARSTNRTKEIILRKVCGGNRIQLISQFLCESVLLILISVFLVICLIVLLLPGFNTLTGKTVHLSNAAPLMALLVIIVAFVTLMISGMYPAIILSSYNLLKVIKGPASQGSKSVKKILVILQFTISIGLMVAAVFVNQQHEFMVNKDLGYQKRNIVVIDFNEGGREKYDILKQELLELPFVGSVCCTSDLPCSIVCSTDDVSWPGKDPKEKFSFYYDFVNYDFTRVFEMKLSDGRAWDRRFSSDSMSIIVNREALRIIGIDNPIGQTIKLWNEEYKIIGIVDNFNFQNLKHNIEPLIMAISKPWQKKVCIKLNSEKDEAIIKVLEESWKKIYPDQLFRYSFFDHEFETYYQPEKRMMKLFIIFGYLSILISGLGLFALSVFIVQNKLKEIAIRKAVGASLNSILKGILWDFIKWIIISNLLGWISSYFFIDWWLRGYAYRINIQPDVFLITGVISTIIALFTVSFQSIKASKTNPIEFLKLE